MSLRRLATLFVRLAVIVVGVLCLLFLAGAIVLHTQPRLLLDPVEKAITEALPGSQLTALSARPSLWPSPGVTLQDVVLRLPGGDALFAESLEGHLDWGTFLQRRLSLSLIVLNGFNARLIWPDRPSNTVSQTEDPEQALPALLQGLRLQLRSGHLELLAKAPSDNSAPPPAPLLDLRDINGQILLPADTRPGALKLRVGSLRQTLLDDAPLPVPHTLRQLDVRFDGLWLDPAAPLGLRLHGATVNLLTGPGNLLDTLALQLQLSPPQGTKLQGNVLVEASLRPDAYPASARALLHADLPFILTSGAQWTLYIDDGRVALDNDNARLTMTIRSDATASGTARIAHLSLPHWFSFARTLPDGLIAAFNTLSGTLAFSVDAQGIDVPELHAVLAGHSFTGSASLKDFQRPLLTIKASTQSADLAQLLPELDGAQKEKPVFAVPPLDAPSPKSASHDASQTPATSVSDSAVDKAVRLNYDIRLRAGRAQFKNLSGKGLHAIITPVPSNPDSTRLVLGVDSLYGGTARMILDIADRCAIRLKAQNLDARILNDLLPKGVDPQGVLHATATLSAPSGNIGTLMQRLSGNASVELLNGSLSVAGARRAFSRLQLSTTGQHSQRERASDASKLFWKGAWELHANASSPSVPLAPLDLTLKLDGETAFLSSPFTPLGGRSLTARATGTLLGGYTDCTASLDLTLPKGTLSLRGLRGSLAGCTVQGDVTAASLFDSPSWTAQGQMSCPNLPPLLSKLALPLPQPGAALPKSLSLSASLTLDSSTLRLDNLSGKLDETLFQGSVHRNVRELPHWDVILRLGRLNLTSYLSPSPQTGKSSSPSALTAQLLRGMTANATVNAKELVLGDIPFQQVNARAMLENGILKIAPFSASCGGGPVSATLSATARQDNTTATAFQCTVSEADLGMLSAVTDADVRLRGKARFETRLSGVFHTSDQAFTAQSGTWNLILGAGSFTPLEPRTRKPESTYHMHSATASGTLKDAIITCSDLRILGKDFNARGRGIINLRSNTLDYTINASIPGVPNIPIRYSGSLSDPTRRINAFKTLTSVIGNVGHHAFSLVKDLINVPFSLIK